MATSWVYSKILCPYTEKVPLRKIFENPELAPCQLYNGWVERRWCYIKCKHFNGIYIFETNKIVNAKKMKSIVYKLAKRRRQLKENDEYLKWMENRHLPCFIPFGLVPWGRFW